MTREQAINYLFSCGFTNEQVGDVVRALTYEPTTKNGLAQERYQDLIDYFGDEKVAKIILENRGQFKAWLERIRWHVKRADELARVLEKVKGTTKNDLGIDCISREQALNEFCIYNPHDSIGVDKVRNYLKALPSVTPQEPKTGEWIEHFDESGKWYECDQCHTDWGGAVNYCPNCGADMRGEE